jgi:hypothetical protein
MLYFSILEERTPKRKTSSKSYKVTVICLGFKNKTNG